MNYRFLKIEAGVRCWEDAEINGDTYEDGRSVPFKNGELWSPVIDLKAGIVVDWPDGVEAKFHFKVCDSGSYYLLDDNKNVLASIVNNYVPDGLCHGDIGYGDYIIFSVDGSGNISGFRDLINIDDWVDDE